MVVRRIGEPIQTDEGLMLTLRRAGIRPGHTVRVGAGADGGVLVGSGDSAAELPKDIAAHLFVAEVQ